MSVKAITAVWEHSTQTLGARLVLLAIADYAHDDGGGAFPSIKTLAKKALMSERNVQYALRKLERDGEIAREGTHASGATIWRICLPFRGANIAPGANIAGVQNLQEGVQKTTEGGAKSAPKPLVTVINPLDTPPIVPQTKKTRMTPDWQPSASSVAYAVEWGIPAALVPEVAEDFRVYWLDRPREQRPGWDLTFKNRVRDVADQYRRRARASPRNGTVEGGGYYDDPEVARVAQDVMAQQRERTKGRSG